VSFHPLQGELYTSATGPPLAVLSLVHG